MEWLYQTIVGSLPSTGRLLKQLGLSCQRPLFRATEQHPELVYRSQGEQFPAIRRLAQEAGALILFVSRRMRRQQVLSWLRLLQQLLWTISMFCLLRDTQYAAI